MPNKNYIKGRNKEYKIVKELKEDGFDIAVRSAGSHSPVDIFAIHRDKRIIKFVQAKPNSMSDNDKNKIYDEMFWLNGNWTAKFIVI